MTTAEEKWRDKPPSAVTSWLLTVVAGLGFVAAVLTQSWWKGFADGAGVLCGILACTAWRARRHARLSKSN
jgi:hypothetical protein